MCQVKRRSFLSLSATILGGGLIAGKTAHSLQNGGQGAPAGAYHVHAVSVMTETANRFLAALSPEQRAKATFQFSDDERMDWHFIPKERKGLTLREMSPYQKHLASALLAAGSIGPPAPRAFFGSAGSLSRTPKTSAHIAIAPGIAESRSTERSLTPT